MIYFLIGTKAQLIKMFPLMVHLQKAGIPFRYIDTVQHGPLCENLRKKLALPEPDHFLCEPGTQIEGIAEASWWALRITLRGIFDRRKIFPKKGVVLVHGDTLSTLVGLIIGRLGGNTVCHVEAGERTHRLLRPFPEEIIRRIVDRFSDLLLACGERQHRNIQEAGIRRRAVNLGHNTLLDAVLAVAHMNDVPGDDTDSSRGDGHVLISIHRFETITSRSRMTFLVDAIERLCKTNRVVFGIHPPTRHKLISFGLMPRLERLVNLQRRSLFDYPDFIRAMSTSKFILTDGGGPQEESYYLGVPCLLLRSETERIHPNVYMADWSLEKVDWFDENCARFRRAPLITDFSPAAQAIQEILQHSGALHESATPRGMVLPSSRTQESTGVPPATGRHGDKH